MKQKLFIFLIIFFLILTNNTLGVLAQNTASPKNVSRVVLVELFAQKSCSSCPVAEFCLEDLAWEYGTSKFILVEEHLWGDGYDTIETNARYNWYVDVDSDKRGTPDVFINGLTKRFQGLVCDCVEGNYNCYKEAIDKELTESPLVELSASKTITESNYIIEGMIKNIGPSSLKNLALSGMIVKEGAESGLYCYVLKIFPFQEIPQFLPGNTFNFKFTSEILIDQKTKLAEEKETLHWVVFVQDLKTKNVLQSFYIK